MVGGGVGASCVGPPWLALLCVSLCPFTLSLSLSSSSSSILTTLDLLGVSSRRTLAAAPSFSPPPTLPACQLATASLTAKQRWISQRYVLLPPYQTHSRSHTDLLTSCSSVSPPDLVTATRRPTRRPGPPCATTTATRRIFLLLPLLLLPALLCPYTHVNTHSHPRSLGLFLLPTSSFVGRDNLSQEQELQRPTALRKWGAGE